MIISISQYPKGELNGIELMVDTAPHGARFIEEW